MAKPTVVHNYAEGLKQPTLLVSCPRGVRDFYWHSPWSSVIAAAEAGKDGLTVWNTLEEIEQPNGLKIAKGLPRLWQGPQLSDPVPPDVAYFREGQHDLAGVTCLYQQNFTDKEQ